MWETLFEYAIASKAADDAAENIRDSVDVMVKSDSVVEEDKHALYSVAAIMAESSMVKVTCLYKAGMSALNVGDLAMAKEAFAFAVAEAVVAANVSHKAQMQLMLGLTLYKMGDDGGALKALCQALEELAKGGNADCVQPRKIMSAHVCVARIYMTRKQYTQAAAHYDAGLQKDMSVAHPTDLFTWGCCLAAMGDYARSESVSAVGIATAPNEMKGSMIYATLRVPNNYNTSEKMDRLTNAYRLMKYHGTAKDAKNLAYCLHDLAKLHRQTGSAQAPSFAQLAMKALHDVGDARAAMVHTATL